MDFEKRLVDALKEQYLKLSKPLMTSVTITALQRLPECNILRFDGRYARDALRLIRIRHTRALKTLGGEAPADKFLKIVQTAKWFPEALNTIEAPVFKRSATK
ncbi:uncharacterized protein PADG_00618 [Paracoccidioides brasiliensis Pb18]|uniref:Uncharacterized protein n=1 Tax=Paracoccidioides brasiliensis (strain Pb18) TaxID=502780 RepID=C1G178_PARBD|nr:uncharacterized protein PADG_00618 [Paracoccidioides brasiliensis Pb18]EEH44329.2 hypothetical protein PADG_00618 [Paracoccidioides brasiliensis Pb18]